MEDGGKLAVTGGVQHWKEDLEVNDGRDDVDEKKLSQAKYDFLDSPADLNEPFLCFICLELVHKPVVNACGHMFCFWCVHHAMNVGTESYCPLCRRAYIHFPRICEQLHFLLLKAVPESYRRRCKEVYEEEIARGEGQSDILFSPQLNDGLNFDVSGDNETDVFPTSALDCTSSAAAGVDHAHSVDVPEDVMLEDHPLVNVRDAPMSKGKLTATSLSSSSLKTELEAREGFRENNDVLEWGTPSSSPFVTESDLLCGACKKLLYRPVVVNCGHVFCEACIWRDGDASDTILKCSTCASLHPGSFPHVCLELHQYLEQNFSVEYERRKSELASQPPELQKGRNNQAKDLLSADMCIKALKSTPQSYPRMHQGIGCDGCGMFPMQGQRFKCEDCPEKPGYDLCFPCFKNGKHLAGRFNQQHTFKHRVREVTGSSIPFDEDSGEPSEGMETYFGLGYFA